MFVDDLAVAVVEDGVVDLYDNRHDDHERYGSQVARCEHGPVVVDPAARGREKCYVNGILRLNCWNCEIGTNS